MYSFEGQYRRVPQQNLAGASTHQKRDEILHKAHLDRMKREENRKKLLFSIRIQAHVRSYLARQKVKNEERKNFDDIANKYQKMHQSQLNGQVGDDMINQMISKLIYFYDREKDITRLVFVSQKIIARPGNIIVLISNKNNNWNFKLKKLLLFHLSLTTTGRETFTTHLRMLDMFTNENTYSKYICPERGTELVHEVLFYLLQRGYFECLKSLIDEKVPPMLEPRSDPPTPFAASLIELIQRALKLAFESHYSPFSKCCVERFIVTFLTHEFTEPVRFFVIPNLSVYKYFPYSELVHILFNISTLDQKNFFNSWLMFSFVSLKKEQYLESCVEEEFAKFLNVLSLLSHNLCKSGTRHVNGNESDSDSDDELDQTPAISKQESEVLEETSIILNKYTIVQAIISKMLAYQDSAYGEQIVQSLSHTCYHLLSAKKSGLHEYKLLCSLALSSQFLRKLWRVIITKEQPSLFGNSATFVNIISRGMNLPLVYVQVIVPMLTTFSSLMTLLITTLHDNEFYHDEAGPSKLSPMPFSLTEMAEISLVLKELSIGLIELAYPDCTSNFLSNLNHDISSQSSDDKIIKNMWPRLFKVTVTLLRQLHSRDMGRPFCADGMWVSSRVMMIKLEKPLDFQHIVRRRQMRPFNLMPYTREDLEEGPPVSNRELRSMTVIKEMPFLLPFQERVLLFHNHVIKDKLVHQGDAPYATRGRTIDITVRRNYLYEDALDNLSPANAPDLRHVMRVQLKNAVGVSEAGVDGGGLSREFLSELLKTSFDPNRGFFRLTTDNQLYPNPHVALLHPDFPKHYYFIGRILGKAMYENLLVELPLAEFFLSKLVSRRSDVSIHQLASLDPVIYRNLLFLKNYDGDISDLGLDFTVVIDELGETKIEELKPNGAEIPVTNENKIEYIHLVADYKLNKQISVQYTAFKNGLSDVIQLHWLHMFSNKELQILISGSEIPVDLNDLKRHARYSGGFHENHPTIKFFWQAMEEFNDDERRLLLKFVTSCSRQPFFGFKDMDPPFCIQKAGSADRLPTASTCMNLLKLPEFKEYQLLKDRILYAIQSGAGFELS